MKLIWKIVIFIVVIGIIAIVIIIGINNQPNEKRTTQKSDYAYETPSNLEEEILFVENVEDILDDLENAINVADRTTNYSDTDTLINSEKSFQRKLRNLDSRLSNLSYPNSYANYRNEMCRKFDNICMYERRMINSLEAYDYDGYERNFKYVNNNLEDLFDSYNSMIDYFNNKY